MHVLSIWLNRLLDTPFLIQLLQNAIVSSILPFFATWMYSYHYFLSRTLTNPRTNTHTPKCTNSAESFPNISIPLFTVCLRLNHWLLFWPLNVEEGKEKTSSVRFYNISLHEKWILVRTPGNLIGLLLLLLQLYFRLTSRVFRSSL